MYDDYVYMAFTSLEPGGIVEEFLCLGVFVVVSPFAVALGRFGPIYKSGGERLPHEIQKKMSYDEKEGFHH